MQKWLVTLLSWLVVLGFLSILVIGIFNALWPKAQQVSGSVGDVAGSIDEFARYEGGTFMGGEVISASGMYKERPNFSILIKTGATPSGFYALNTSESTGVCYSPSSSPDIAVGTPTSCSVSTMVSTRQMKDTNDNVNYVNPNVRFDAEVYRDANGIPRLIEFIQK